jgi:hypothetical protein
MVSELVSFKRPAPTSTFNLHAAPQAATAVGVKKEDICTWNSSSSLCSFCLTSWRHFHLG